MEQNENNKIETAREDNAATTQTSHEEMQQLSLLTRKCRRN